MRVALCKLKKPASLVLIVLLLVHFLMLVLLLLMGVSVGTPPPHVVEQDGPRLINYSEISAQLLKTSPCQGVNPGNLSSWQPVFIVVITANPSTTEVHSFAFLRCCLDNKFILQKEDSYIDHRSIVSFAENSKQLRFLLKPLLARATNFVPTRFRMYSPIVFRATSALRNLVSRRDSNRLMFKVRALLRASSFRVRSHQVTIMEKSEEAADLWLSAAFLTGRLYAHVSPPLAVAHLAGGTLWVAVPVTRKWPLVVRRDDEGIGRSSAIAAPAEERPSTKRSRRDRRSDEVLRQEFRLLGGPRQKGNAEKEESSAVNVDQKKDEIDQQGQTSSLHRPLRLAMTTISMDMRGQKKSTFIRPSGATAPHGEANRGSPYPSEEPDKTRQRHHEKVHENYLNKSFENYLQTFISDMRRQTPKGSSASTSKYTKTTSSLRDDLELGESNVDAHKILTVSKRLNLKFADEKRRKTMKEKPQRLSRKKRNFRRQISATKRDKNEEAKTQFLLCLKMNEFSFRGDRGGLSSFISIWCNNSSAGSQNKRFNSPQKSNLDESFLHKLSPWLKSVLDSYCRRMDPSKLRDERLFLARNNVPHMHAKRGPKGASPDSKFHKNHRPSTQNRGRIMHRKLSGKRRQGRLKAPDGVAADENEVDGELEEGMREGRKRRERDRRWRGKENDGAEERGKKGGEEEEEKTERSRKLPFFERKLLKIPGCNEIERSKRSQTYCPSNSGGKPAVAVDGKRGNGETAIMSVKWKVENNNLPKLHFKRIRRRKNKSYAGLEKSSRIQIPETSGRYLSGRDSMRRGRGKKQDLFVVDTELPLSPIRSGGSRPTMAGRFPKSTFATRSKTGDRGLIRLVMTRHKELPSSSSLPRTDEEIPEEEATEREEREGKDYPIPSASDIVEDAGRRRSESFVKPTSVKSSRKSVPSVAKRSRRRVAEEKEVKEEEEYVRLSANVTFRCSPSRKFWLFATSFPLGIYPARVSILLAGNYSSGSRRPFGSSLDTRFQGPTLRPPRRRSDIPPEEEYNFVEKDFSLTSSTFPPRLFLTPLPEPRGPGPPSQFILKGSGSSSSDVPLESAETSTPLFSRIGNISSSGPRGETSGDTEKSNWNRTENVSGNVLREDGFLRNESLKNMWTLDTLQKVKNVVDSILRAIGSVRITEEMDRRKLLEEYNVKSPRKATASADEQWPQRNKVSTHFGRIQSVISDFKSKKRKTRKRKPKVKLINRILSTNRHTDAVSSETVNKKILVGPWHQEALAHTASNESIANHSHLNVKHTLTSKYLNNSKPSVPKVGTISSVTDLLFTVPNLRVIKPIENSKVDSAIKSTEKLVRTSLTDLLYSVPLRSNLNKTANSSNSSDWNGPTTTTANVEAFPHEGFAASAPRVSKFTDPLAGEAFDEITLQSSCIPVGSKGRFTINDVSYLVVGRRSLTNRTRECWEEATKIVEKYITVPPLVEMDVLATAAFYFVAATANLMDSTVSAGYVRPSAFRTAADEVCSRPQEMLPDPLVCLDYQFVAALLLRSFQLPPERPIMVCDYLGGFQLSSALGTALNYLQGH